MTTTVTKITAAPYITTYTNPALVAATTAKIAVPKTTLQLAANAFAYLESVNVFLVGQKDAALEPTKGMTTWMTASLASRKANTVDLQTSVSSWTIVVDFTWSTLHSDVWMYNTSSPGTYTAQPAGTVGTGTVGLNIPLATQTSTLNRFGDSFGVLFINEAAKTYAANAIRIGRKVTTAGVTAVAASTGVTAVSHVVQVTTTVAESWTYTAPTIADYAKAGTAAAAIGFTAVSTCDTTKWASATACNGVDKPWAFGTITEAKAATTSPVAAAVIGTVRAHHFLAEKAASVTTNFSIEATNKLDYCIFEYVDYYKAAATDTYDAKSNAHHWYYGQYTVAALGATSTLLGAAALVSSVLVSMF